MQDVVGISLRNSDAERLQSGAYTRDGRVVISALHVDGARVATLPFCDVICNVGNEVGVFTALLRRPLHHAILIVTEIRGAQPECAVFLVREAAGDERRDRRINLAINVKRALEIVRVEDDSECFQIEILLRAQRDDSKLPDRIRISDFEICRVLRSIVSGNLTDVIAVIPVLGKRDILAGLLLRAQLHASLQIVDLTAAVVVVELTTDFPPRPVE